MDLFPSDFFNAHLKVSTNLIFLANINSTGNNPELVLEFGCHTVYPLKL